MDLNRPIRKQEIIFFIIVLIFAFGSMFFETEIMGIKSSSVEGKSITFIIIFVIGTFVQYFQMSKDKRSFKVAFKSLFDSKNENSKQS